MNKPRTYTNPVMKGFFPDPSIIRVGEDYYMVNSTFQYFPAIVISHSRDLVHWEVIGHAITQNDDLDLSDIDDSHGIWRPCKAEAPKVLSTRSGCFRLSTGLNPEIIY